MNNKKCSKFLVFGLSITLCLMFAGVGLTNAQQTLPAGGSSFETVVKIMPGQYQGSALETDQEVYYYFEAKPGQLAHFKDTFVPAEEGTTWHGITFYNENKEELISRTEFTNNNVELSWLLDSAETSYKIYAKILSAGSSTKSFTLDFSLIDKSDANSGKDAGDTFDKFVNIAPGKYNGYLSGYDSNVNQVGNDLKDNYKVGLKKGITYEFKLTPPSKASLDLALYDSYNQLLKEEASTNEGAIISLPLVPSTDTNVFVSVSNYYMPAFSYEIVNYQLEIKSSVPLIKFYTCDGQYCSEVGEFDSLSTCQKTTTKTCYQTENCNGECASPNKIRFYSCKDKICESVGDHSSSEECQRVAGKTCYQTKNCDGKCGVVPPPVECAKDSDCSTGKICKNSKCESLIPPSGCAKDSDCPAGNVCKDGKCVASPLPPPGPGLTERLLSIFKNLNWLYIGIVAGLVVLAIIVLILLLRKKPAKKENIPPATFSGSKEADKPVVGYKHPCKYCEKFIPPNSTVCPLCGKINPLGPYRCPKCHEPVEKDWQACSRCGQNLRIVCPKCGKVTFFGDYCEDCCARLLVICPHCNQEQPPLSDKCIKCGKPMEKK